MTIKAPEKCSYFEVKEEYKRTVLLIFTRSFTSVALVPLKRFEALTQTESLSLEVCERTKSVVKPSLASEQQVKSATKLVP